ncbi:MAG: low specificity L-threonine aldolase [Polyangiaceae bacterium]|nr:low specificity L-threonine aldolase [Polyangiaceae bacterium]
MREIADLAEGLTCDLYGEGELIEGFEREVAALLGKEAAVFMPSGTMAQQIAMRIWSEQRGSTRIGFHSLCHLEMHEQMGYRYLHGLHGVHLGNRHKVLTAADLSGVVEPLAAVLVELPQREIGGQLPSWEELLELRDVAQARSTALHLDGARLWESGPFYGRPYAEIAALFDSVYVSFYKGLGGIAGCALLGSKTFIAQAKVWQRRHGGNLVHLYPEVLSAKLGLQKRLPRMGEYWAKAKSIATELGGMSQIDIVPNPPHTNMLHLHLRGDAAKLEGAARAIAEEDGIWMFGKLRPTALQGAWLFELTVGDGTLELADREIRGLFEKLFLKAAAAD